MPGKRYDFFISYAHDDVERVRELDKALRALLRRPLRRAGFQIFRDETGLAASPDLGSRLRAALDQSSWLLVALTPSSSRSPWVDREIEYWCDDLGRADRLLIVRVDQSIDLAWDENAGRFRSPSDLPPALVRGASAEPLYVDLPAGPPENAAVRVAAAVLGRSPEDVAGEDLRLHRRRRRFATAAIVGLAVLTLAAVAASVLAIRGQREARTQARQAVADALAARALVEASERPDKAFALALASRRLDPEGSGADVLLRLVADVQGTDRFFRVDTAPTAVALSSDGDTYAIGDSRGAIRLGEFGTEPVQEAAELGAPVVGIAFAADDRVVAGLADGLVVELALDSDGSLAERSSVTVPIIDAWAFEPGSGRIAVLSKAATKPVLKLVESKPNGLRVRASASPVLARSPRALSFDQRGTRLAVAGNLAVDFFESSTLAPLVRESMVVTLDVEAVALRGPSLVAGGTPLALTDRAGLVAGYELEGRQQTGSVGFAQAVDSLTACRKGTFFGTTAGEYGWLGDPVESTRVIGDLGERISSIGCNDAGGFIVAGDRGFVHMRSRESRTAANIARASGRGDDSLWDDRHGMRLAPNLEALQTAAGEMVRFGEAAPGLGAARRRVPGRFELRVAGAGGAWRAEHRSDRLQGGRRSRSHVWYEGGSGPRIGRRPRPLGWAVPLGRARP